MRWHPQVNGHEFEQALGDGEGQGSLACCSPRGRKESDTTECLNNNKFSSVNMSESRVLALDQSPKELSLCAKSF